jgi:hypothetical protein
MLDQLATAGQRLAIERVIHPAAFPSVGDQTGVFEHLQVKRKPGLGRIERIGQLANAPLPCPKALQDLKSSLIRQGMKDLAWEGSTMTNSGCHEGNISTMVDVSTRHSIHHRNDGGAALQFCCLASDTRGNPTPKHGSVRSTGHSETR